MLQRHELNGGGSGPAGTSAPTGRTTAMLNPRMGAAAAWLEGAAENKKAR